jgi:hypothetical protein
MVVAMKFWFFKLFLRERTNIGTKKYQKFF